MSYTDNYLLNQTIWLPSTFTKLRYSAAVIESCDIKKEIADVWLIWQSFIIQCSF